MDAVAGTRTAARESTTSERLVRFLNKTPIHIALGLIALIWLAPTVGLLVTSFRPRSDIQVTGWWESFLQFRYTLANYQEVLTSQGMLDAFVNTLLIAVPSTLIPLTLAIFLLRNFFITLPRDLIEAARIDGSSTIGIFRTIVVPLSVPAIAAYWIFQFLWVWNDLLMALVYVQRDAAQPMTVEITQLLGTYASEWSLLAAASFLVMVVPLVVFFSLQRYFVQGLLAGSVK